MPTNAILWRVDIGMLKRHSRCVAQLRGNKNAVNCRLQSTLRLQPSTIIWPRGTMRFAPDTNILHTCQLLRHIDVGIYTAIGNA